MFSKMDGKIETVLNSLKTNNFDAKFAEDGETAKKMISDMIPNNAIVSFGDSATIRQIHLLGKLKTRALRVINPFARKLIGDESKLALRIKMEREALTSDVFITGTNAVTLDGRLVNTDSVGNRVAAMIFGPKKVIVIAGKNKIVINAKEALHRIKNIIAPYHAKKLESPTPCAITGKCSDCFSDRRICNVTTILEKKPRRTDITVIIIDEDLGLGWDETWSQERVNRIKSNYDKVRIFGKIG